MNTQKTLDGQTAHFIADVANALPRSIDSVTMSAYKPYQLQVLLSVLVAPEMIDLLPAMASYHGIHDSRQPRLKWIALRNIPNLCLRKAFALEEVFEHVIDGQYAFLPMARAEFYANLIAGLRKLMPPCWFFYLEDGKRGAFVTGWNDMLRHERLVRRDNAWTTERLAHSSEDDIFFFSEASDGGEKATRLHRS